LKDKMIKDEKVKLIAIFLIEEKKVALTKKISLWYKYHNPDIIINKLVNQNLVEQCDIDYRKSENILKNNQCITIYDSLYPFIFLNNIGNIYPPSPVIFYRGNIDLLVRGSKQYIGIVGSRKSCTFSENYINALIGTFYLDDSIIVSGFAKGIDYCAHECALQYRVPTIGILGSGIDIIYPKKNISLYRKIIDTGSLLLSEYPPDSIPVKYHFPFRNRIISFFSDKLHVIQAGIPSGALITADYSTRLNKEVFVLKGSDDYRYDGNRKLVKENNVKEIICFAKENFIYSESVLFKEESVIKKILWSDCINSKKKKILTTILFNPYISFTNLLKNYSYGLDSLIEELIVLLADKLVIETSGKRYYINFNNLKI